MLDKLLCIEKWNSVFNSYSFRNMSNVIIELIIKHIFSGRNIQTNVRRMKKQIQKKISKSNIILSVLTIIKRI